jgi:hypothetical protein
LQYIDIREDVATCGKCIVHRRIETGSAAVSPHLYSGHAHAAALGGPKGVTERDVWHSGAVEADHYSSGGRPAHRSVEQFDDRNGASGPARHLSAH